MNRKTGKPNNDVVEILKSGDINSIYFNEFALGVSKNDIFILLRSNGKEEAILNASHITAKSLVIALNDTVKKLADEEPHIVHSKIYSLPLEEYELQSPVDVIFKNIRR